MQLTSEQQLLIRRWTIALIAFGLVCRLIRFALGMPIWGDEAMLGLNVIARSYQQLLAPLDNAQVSPVGFLWSLRFIFDHFGVSDYSARLPALIAGVAALLVFWIWVRSLVDAPAAAIATGILAVSHYIVRHGVELKPYAFDLLAAVILLWLGTRCLTSKETRWFVGLIVAAPFCAVVSFPQVFVAASLALALLWDARRGNRGRQILTATYCVVAGASFIWIWRCSASGQFHASSNALRDYWHAAFPPVNPIKFLLWFVQVHTGNLFAYPIGGKNGASIITLILYVIGMRGYWPRWNTAIRLLLIAPFPLTFLAALLRLYPYGESARVSQHLAPVIVLAAGAGAAALIEAASKLGSWRVRFSMVCSLLFAIGLGGLAANVIWPYKTKADMELRGDVRSLVAAAGNNPIFVLQPIEGLPPTLRWYLSEGRQAPLYAANIRGAIGPDVQTAYVVNCDRARAGAEAELAAESDMRAVIMSSRDLQLGPKENGPDRIEIVRLAR